MSHNNHSLFNTKCKCSKQTQRKEFIPNSDVYITNLSVSILPVCNAYTQQTFMEQNVRMRLPCSYLGVSSEHEPTRLHTGNYHWRIFWGARGVKPPLLNFS